MKLFRMLIIAFVLTGCASGSSLKREPGGPVGGGSVKEEAETGDITDNKRVIIFNADITIETDDTAAVSARVTSLAAKYGGYVLSTSDESVVIRVQSGKFEAAVDEIKKLDNDVSVRIFSEDVTEAYRDTQIRLDNKLKARDRYLELLKKAENVQAALQVERELERLNVEIEELKGRINRLSHLAEYSTITVRIEEEVKPGPLGYVFYGAYRVVKWLFIRN